MRRTSQNKPDKHFRTRRTKCIKLLGNSIAMFPSAECKIYSRDQYYTFRQDSNFFYFTGLDEQNAILVLRGKGETKSILYLKETDSKDVVWEGESLTIAKARRRIAVDDIRPIQQFEEDFPDFIEQAESIHYALGSSKLLDRLTTNCFQSPVLPQYNRPHSLIDSRELTSTLRIKKDRQEIQLLKRASEITARGLREIASHLKEMKNEKQCALQLESYFAKYGARSTSFRTIVAAGKNSTTLHHSPTFSPLWQKDLVLIDCGAEFNGYAGDITRVFPVSGQFSEHQALVYDAVYEAVQIGISLSEPGSSLEDIHQGVVKSITKSLVSLSILSGNVNQLIASGAYKKYFMHRTGHWLGLDVHDIAPAEIENIRAPSALIPLEPGMVFTIEPGLYFSHTDREIPKEFRGIGIRLEEDILITAKGSDVLSQAIPLERGEIENLVNR